jgi:hypothetical protein
LRFARDNAAEQPPVDPPPAPNDFLTGLKAYWAFGDDGGGAVRLTDSNGNAANTLTAIDAGPPVVLSPGGFGDGAWFVDPVPRRLQLSELDFMPGPGQDTFTMSCWVILDATSAANSGIWELTGLVGSEQTARVWLGCGSGIGDAVGRLVLQADNPLSGEAGVYPADWFEGSQGGVMAVHGDTVLPYAPAGAWTHVVAVFDGGSIQLYVNGVLDGSLACEWPWDFQYGVSNPLFRLGAGGNLNPFRGGLDEVAYWTRSLASEEVMQLYSGGKNGKPVFFSEFAYL